MSLDLIPGTINSAARDIRLEPGLYYVRADLKLPGSEEVIANASVGIPFVNGAEKVGHWGGVIVYH